MLVDLDGVIVIYVVEGASSFQARAQAHLAALTSARPGDVPQPPDFAAPQAF